MALPVPTKSATVHLGSPDVGYLSPFLANSCYSFYRGTTRWMCLWSNYAPFDTPAHPVMFKSADDGATWTGPLDNSAPSLSREFLQASPCYDYRFAAGGDVGIHPSDAAAIGAMCNVTPTVVGFIDQHWAFVDFDFQAESWGAPHDQFTSPFFGASAFHFSSAPNGNLVYLLYTVAPAVVGASVIGSSPWLTVDAGSNAHYGGHTATHDGAPSFRAQTERAGNVRIHSGRAIFARVRDDGQHLDILSRAVGAPEESEWDLDTVTPAAGLFSRTREPWLYDAQTLYWIGPESADKIYRSRKSGSVWGPGQVVWSLADDTNPDLAGNAGGADPFRDYQGANRVVVSPNPKGGVEVAFHYNGFATGYGEAVLTFHLPGGARNRYYGAP